MAQECPLHSGMIAEIENLKTSDGDQWEEIKTLRTRLPVWGTMFISFLTFLLGASMTYAAFAVKMAELVKKP